MIKDYLKICENIDDYYDFKFSEDFVLPNVTLVEDEKQLYLNDENSYYNGHEYIDLGLPSGTLWAKKNVGAEMGSDYGLYFAWGNVEGFTEDSGHAFNEDNYQVSGYTIGTDEKLPLKYDAAQKYMGGLWHMPTKEQCDELIENCDHEILEKQTRIPTGNTDTLKYIKLTSKINSNNLFMPIGYIENTSFKLGTNCFWTNQNSDIDHPYSFAYDKENEKNKLISNNKDVRYHGLQVRGVVDKK